MTMSSFENSTDHGAEALPPTQRPARSRVLKGAHAAFNNEFSAIPCKVRNLSETGARIVFEGGWFVPDRFMLHVDIDGYKVECERVWQKGSECGAHFLGEKIKTGEARQQVLTPDAVNEETSLPRAESRSCDAAIAAAPRAESRPRDAAISGAPRPEPGRSSGGFGRRTR